MNLKKILFLVLLCNIKAFFSQIDEQTEIQEESIENNQTIYRDYILTPIMAANCSNVLISHIYPLIKQLEDSGVTGLNPNIQTALDTWLDLYTEMKCFDQSTSFTTGCGFVLNGNMFRLINLLQKSSTGLNTGQLDALDIWIDLYKRMKCFDQSTTDCSFVLNNIFPLVVFMETGGTLSAAQQEALFYWTGVYRDMKCAGCGCTGGCTGVCPVCPCSTQN